MVTDKSFRRVFVGWLVLVLIFSPLLWLESGENKGFLNIFFNQRQTPFGNSFFRMITLLGTAYAYIPFLAYYLWRKRFKGYALLLVWGIQAILVTGMKHLVFGEWTRPTLFLKDTYQFKLIEGVDYATRHSMPSGHTATCFAMVLCLLMFQKRRLWLLGLGFSVLVLVPISRIYLLQHFFIDTYAGMIVGGFSAFLGCFLLRGKVFSSEA